MSLKVLFVGGTGQISLPCVAAAHAAGHSVTVFNRGKTSAELPEDVTQIAGDTQDQVAYRALAEHRFDVVCQFMVFTPEQMAADIATFSGRVGQYIYISSASVYEKPARHYVISERTPAINPYWGYSQAKIACEQLLMAAPGMKWTIVRPSHTVRTGLPTMMGEGDLLAHRMLAGKPILVAGDGTAPWTLTRSQDFAIPFVRLFAQAAALGEAFHITSDRAHTWDAIYTAMAAGLGVTARIVHVPTDTLVAYHPDWTGPLLGDKTWTALFDNSKVKAVVGSFSCNEDLSVILAEPLTHFHKRLAASGPRVGELDGLIDRIATEQGRLGRT